MKELNALIRKWDSYAKGTAQLGCRKEHSDSAKRNQPFLRARADTMRDFVADLRELKRQLQSTR